MAPRSSMLWYRFCFVISLGVEAARWRAMMAEVLSGFASPRATLVARGSSA